MQTLTLQIINNNANKVLQTLEEKHFIKIIDRPSFNSPALPGTIMKLQEFKNWIADSEASTNISLNDAKALWQNKKIQLQQIAK